MRCLTQGAGDLPDLPAKSDDMGVVPDELERRRLVQAFDGTCRDDKKILPRIVGLGQPSGTRTRSYKESAYKRGPLVGRFHR